MNRKLRTLTLIYEHEGATRAELEQLTGLSQTSVVRLVADLREKGLLLEKRDPGDRDGRGRPTDVLHINPQSGYVAGIEFGEGNLIITIVDAVGQIVHWTHEAVPSFIAGDETMNILVDVAQRVVHSRGIAWDQVFALGVAPHDIVSAHGDWIYWNHPDVPPYPAERYLSQKLRRFVIVENISRSFAVAEHRFGAGRGKPDMLYLFIGKHGIGAGIIVNNTLVNTFSGICGEIGHIVVEEEGKHCKCGNRGCLVTIATHDEVVARLQQRINRGIVTSLKNPFTFAQICEAADRGDKGAYMVLHEIAQYIAKALSSSVNITGTTFVILGGQYTLAGKNFLTDLSAALRQRVIPHLARHIEVNYASLPQHAGAWGVAVQALDAAWKAGRFVVVT